MTVFFTLAGVMEYKKLSISSNARLIGRLDFKESLSCADG